MSIAMAPSLPSSPPSPSGSRNNLAELLHELGDIPAHRVRLYTYPGTATEADAVHATNTERPSELINGTLVEKAKGVPESFLASLMLQFVGPFVRLNKLGITTAPGMYKMIGGTSASPTFPIGRNRARESPVDKSAIGAPICAWRSSARATRRRSSN